MTVLVIIPYAKDVITIIDFKGDCYRDGGVDTATGGIVVWMKHLY